MADWTLTAIKAEKDARKSKVLHPQQIPKSKKNRKHKVGNFRSTVKKVKIVLLISFWFMLLELKWIHEILKQPKAGAMISKEANQ